MVELSNKIVNSPSFSKLILSLIILSGLLVGVETYPAFDDGTVLGRIVDSIQGIILIVFVIEIFLKIIACGSRPFDYFREPWNVFDFAIVVACLLPINMKSMTVVRLLRILRSLRMITILPRLRLLVSALLRSIPSLGYIGILLGLHFYIFSVIGTITFGKNDPIRFGSLHMTSTTLFQVLTLEGWNDVRDTQVMGSDITYDDSWKELTGEERQSLAMPVAATVYFVTFIVLGTMIMLNLFTGVIISSMEEAQGEVAAASAADREEQLAEKGFLTVHDELHLLHEKMKKISEQLAALQPATTGIDERKS